MRLALPLFFVISLSTAGLATAHTIEDMEGPRVNFQIYQSEEEEGMLDAFVHANGYGHVSVQILVEGEVANTGLRSTSVHIEEMPCQTLTFAGQDDRGATEISVTFGDACDGQLADIGTASHLTGWGGSRHRGSNHMAIFNILDSGSGALNDPTIELSHYDGTWTSTHGAGGSRAMFRIVSDPLWCGDALISAERLSDGARAGAVVSIASSACAPAAVPPTIDLGEDVEKLPAKDFQLSALIEGQSESYQLEIDWGDGQTESLTVEEGQVEVTHKYPGKGVWTIEACASDDIGEDCDMLQLTQDGAHGKPSPEQHPGNGKAKGLN